jgi:hypothetical protein
MSADKRFSAGHGEKRGRKLTAFVTAVMTTPTIEAAAATVGIAASTARRWMQHPDTIQALAAARRDAMKAALAKLQQIALEAVNSLSEIQRAGESESARVSAAKTVLEQAMRAVELEDVQARLAKLEVLARGGWRGAADDAANPSTVETAGDANGHA